MKIKKPSFRTLNRLVGQPIVLAYRWARRKSKTNENSDAHVEGIEGCKVVYINLDARSDRNAEILDEYKKLGIENYERFSAHANDNGALGCAMSHASVIKEWSPKEQPILMVCEDDCSFSISKQKIDETISEFSKNPYLDVLCLGYNERNSYQITKDFKITTDTQTMSCYLLKAHMREPMLKICDKSIDLLSQNLPGKIAAIDVVWKELHKTHFIALSNKRAITQRPSYSDIEKIDVTYKV